MLLSCSSSSPGLENDWLYISDASNGTSGTALNLKSDMTYEAGPIQQTSANTFETQVETGTFQTNATQIKFTPTESSCPGTIAPYVVGYTLRGDTLTISSSTTVLVLQLNTSASSTSEALSIGCFGANGFVASPLAPVGSEPVPSADAGATDAG
jgi:hypothetical protein